MAAGDEGAGRSERTGEFLKVRLGKRPGVLWPEGGLRIGGFGQWDSVDSVVMELEDVGWADPFGIGWMDERAVGANCLDGKAS